MPMNETDPVAVFSTSTSPDFALTLDPTTLTANEGSQSTSTIFLTSFNGFNQNVTLSTAATPGNGLTCSLSSTTVNNTAETSSISCGGKGGVYTVTVIGRSGTLLHTTTVPFTVPYITETAAPASILLNFGQLGNSTISLAAHRLYGWASLTAHVSTGGPHCSLSPTTVYLGPPSTSMLSCASATVSYSVNVTATIGTTNSYTTVAFLVRDFSISVDPTSISIAQGPSGSATINVGSLNGFSGTVSLTASGSSTLQTTLSPSATSAPGQATLSITSPSASGNYTVTVTGTSGNIHHTATLTVTVSGTNPQLLPPRIDQITWIHHLSFSRNDGVQTWKIQIVNPNRHAPIYVSVQVLVANNSSPALFTMTSGVYKIGPGQQVTIEENLPLRSANIGTSYTFTITIQWGPAPATPAGLPFTSPSNRTGSFTIVD